MRLLCDENITGLEAIAPRCELRTMSGREISRQALRDVDALWVRSVTAVDAALLEGTPVRLVGTATAGTEHVDQAYLASRGIAFHAAPGANANSVVEYVLAALAALGTPWRRLDAGASLGIVGFGHVGQRLHRVASDLGWQVRVCDPWVEQRATAQGSDVHFTDIDTLLRCEVVSLHCALTGEQPWPSRHLLDARRLAGLNASQWLINAARGEVVDNAALLSRVKNPDSPQVVLDVWEGEPAFDERLLEGEALRLATPHIAGYSWDAKWAATRRLAAATFAIDESELAPPVAAASPLVACSGGDRASLANGLLRQRYDIRVDDRALREAGRLRDPRERGRAFDQLRRAYPLRRELRGSAITPGPDARDTALLSALGIRPRAQDRP